MGLVLDLGCCWYGWSAAGEPLAAGSSSEKELRLEPAERSGG